MAIKPLYRLTVYAPSSEDPTETTVLTPIAGSAHADPFVVATMQGIAGAQPYLAVGKGRQGQLDYVSKKTTTGNLTLSLHDHRVTPGGSNAVRWGTAFLGNALGETRLKGCKFLLERALDGTAASLAPFTAGRIRNVSVNQALRIDLDAKDFADDLNRPLFKGAPHPSIAYASLGPLLPNGLVKPFGNIPLTPPLAGTIGAAFATAPDTVVVNLTTPGVPAAMITQAVLDSMTSTTLRVVELTKVSDGTKHYYQWPRGDSALASTNIGGGPTPHFGLTAFPISMLPVGDVRREALPAVGTAVTVSIVQDAPPTEATPLFISEVHPIQYLADILDGKFSLAPGSTTLRPLATRNTGAGSSWATLLADASFSSMREVVTKLEDKANAYIEKVILQRYNLALVRDGRGNVDVIDLRRKPTLAGVVTLTDDDLVTADDASWDDSRDGAITAVAIDYWLDQKLPATDLVASGDTFPTLSPALIRSTKYSILKLNDLSTLKDVGEKVVTIAARGDRISSGDLLSAHFGRQRRDLVEANLTAAALDFLRPIGSGVITAKATYRTASANAAQIAVGQYAIVQHTKLPDPATNQRGGARLMLCLSRDERDEQISVQWMDAGTGAVALAPAITAVASANPYSVDVTVAANAAGDPIELYVAVTDTTVAVRPADDAAEWLFAVTTAAGTVHVANLPPGKRIWLRAHSVGNAANVKLPSGWVFAPAPGYLDLAAGTAIDPSQPDPAWTPVPTTADTIKPPSCYAFENPIRSTRTTANIFLRGAVGAGSPTPLSWRYTVGGGAPSAWSTAPIASVSINVTRDKFYPTDVLLEVTQPDGQSARFTYVVGPNPTALDPGTGQVDPVQPLAGTSHFIPRATDVNGMILDPGSKESQGKELRRLFAKPLFGDPDTLDANIDGLVYGRPQLSGLTSGQIDLAKSGVIGKHLANILRSPTNSTPLSAIAGNLTDAGHAADAMQTSGSREIRRLLAKGLASDPDTLDATGLDGLAFKRTTVAQVGYADRAGTGLDASGFVQTGVRDAATIGGRAALDIARNPGAVFSETWENDWAVGWTKVVGSGNTVTRFAGALGGFSSQGANFVRLDSRAINGGSGYGYLVGKSLIPFNPSKLYKLVVRLQQAGGTFGSSNLRYAGVRAFRQDLSPANGNDGNEYVVLNGGVASDFTMHEYVGWVKGTSGIYDGNSRGASGDPTSPTALHPDTAYILPLILVNLPGDGTGVTDVDYFQIWEYDEDGSFRTYTGLSEGGDVKGLMYTPGGSRKIVRGGKAGFCRHTDVVVFPATTNLPAVILEGGVNYQPEAKWGTAAQVDAGVGATNAPTAGKAHYRDFAADNLTNSSFTTRARLRIKGGTGTANYDYAANSVSSPGGDTGAVTLAAGPSSNGQYTTRFDITVNCTCLNPSGTSTHTVVIAIDVDDGSGTFVERASINYAVSADAGAGLQSSVNTNQTAVVSATVSGTTGRIRIRAKSAVLSGVKGSGSFTLHGHTASDTGKGVTYSTSAGDQYTSATPDVDDAQAVAYTVVEI